MSTPLVLLHAFPLDPRTWDAVVALLPPGQQVLVPTIPAAEQLAVEPSLDTVADAVAGDVRAAGHARVVVAGLSMGGYVALAVLERHPELVAGLGLLDTRTGADTSEAAQRRLEVAAAVEAEGSSGPVRGSVGTLLGESTRSARPEVTATVAGWIEQQPAPRVAWCQRAMAARPDRTDVLRAFDGPVAVVVGDEDALSGPEVARQTAQAAQDGRLVVVPRSGHLTAVEDPAAVAAALVDLVRRSDR